MIGVLGTKSVVAHLRGSTSDASCSTTPPETRCRTVTGFGMALGFVLDSSPWTEIIFLPPAGASC